MFRLRAVSWGRLDTFGDNLGDPTGVLTSIGAFFKSIAQRTHANQGNPAGSWAPRMVPNIPGIISDLRRSPNVKARRTDERPAVFDTGDLRGSIDYEVEGHSRVIIGQQGPARAYADVQHFGGESESEEVTKDVQDRLIRWIGGEGRGYADDVGWLVEDFWVGKKVPIKVRARPWLDFQKQDHDDLADMLPEYLYAVGGRP